MSGTNLIVDNASTAIIVKDAVLARSGVYTYSYEEMLRRGITPATKKDFYTEYRSPAMLIAAKEKFKYAPVTKEHPHPAQLTGESIQKVIQGVVGSTVDVITLDNGEVALKGEVAFYTKDGVDYFNGGAKETSAQYVAQTVPSTNPKYDFEMQKIESVQALAITKQGRGGPSVSVLDSLMGLFSIASDNVENSQAGSPAEKIKGDKIMGVSILSSLFGIGKLPQDVFATAVMDSLVGYDVLSESDKKKKKETVDAFFSDLKDSPDKALLAGTVADCFMYSKEVLEKKDAVSKGLSALFARCTMDSAPLQETLDVIKGAVDSSEGPGKDDEKEKKDGKKDVKDKETTDSAAAVAAVLPANVVTADSLKEFGENLTKQVTDSLVKLVDESVKKALGLDGKNDIRQTADSVLPFTTEVDTEWLNSMFR